MLLTLIFYFFLGITGSNGASLAHFLPLSARTNVPKGVFVLQLPMLPQSHLDTSATGGLIKMAGTIEPRNFSHGDR